MNTQLFDGKLIRLAAFDPDRDAEIESKWTHDPEYWCLQSAAPMRPLSASQIKSNYAKAEKEPRGSLFHFSIRTLTDDRLVGFARLSSIEWTNGLAHLTLGIGSADDRRKGYGAEALNLMLCYAFDELNLYRLAVHTFEYNQAAFEFLQQAGFCLEVRRRQAIYRAGRRWDLYMFGLLRDDWKAKQAAEATEKIELPLELGR